ncbi:MAG TPA: DUF2058 family protein [Xanthomonadaceae bacterium]|nr:DUF2058 family protein [Xanthomonadaceae bacterium]
MTNSMKDLLMGLGFKQAPPHRDVPVSRAQDAQERPQPEAPKRPPHRDAPAQRAPDSHRQHAQPDARRDRNDTPHHPDPRHPSQRRPSQHPGSPPRNAPHASTAGTTQPRAEQGARPEHGAHRPRHASQQRTREEIDLAKAYAIRAQKEKDERIEAERLKQEAARIKREAKAKVAELLKDKSLNAVDAELTRHFEYNGKIRRVHVTEVQLKSLNAGEFGVVQLDGRYLLVDAALAREVATLLPSLIALLVDPDAPTMDDPYADPKYVVPDDLVW